MAGSKLPQTDVVLAACKQHPDMPELRLAKIIYSSNGKLFTSLEAVRQSIRYFRGKKPQRGKVKGRNGKVYQRKTVSGAHPQVPVQVAEKDYRPFVYRAPKNHVEEIDDFRVAGAQRVLRLSDIHYPFHDRRALEAAIEYGMKMDPTILLLDGDIMDCHDLSFHDKDPRHRYTERELTIMGQELRQFREAFPKARIIWKEGNHEKRLKRYLMNKAPELWGLPMLDIPGLITMANGPAAMHRVEWVDDDRTIYFGHLASLHGHEFRGGGGVNPARWLYLRTGESAVCGHFHRTSEHSEPTLSRKQVGTWSTGCLCDLQPRYLRNNKWNHGFASIHVQANGQFRLKNIRIIDGKIY